MAERAVATRTVPAATVPGANFLQFPRISPRPGLASDLIARSDAIRPVMSNSPSRRPPCSASHVERLLRVLADSIREGDTDPLTNRLETALQGMLSVRLVRLRGAVVRAPHPAMPDNEVPSGRVTLDVPTTRGPYLLDVWLRPGQVLTSFEERLLRAVGEIATLALEIDRARLLIGAKREPRRPGPSPPKLVGASRAIQAVHALIDRVARTDFTVLIEGESGSGKELVARRIHELSGRRRGPFVAVNCAALVETLLEAELFGIEERTATGVRGRRGKFEAAAGGTLFLDEVSDLTPAAQAKLLRAIQDLAVERVGGHGSRRVDVRLLAATNRRLVTLVEEGVFRADLYHRLSGLEILVPPLRARAADIRPLAAQFLEELRPDGDVRLGMAALDALTAYKWPGNVRELRRVIERAVTLLEGSEIGLAELPPRIGQPYREILHPALERGDTLRAWARRYARLVLERHGHNKRQACRALGISYHTLQTYLHSWVGEQRPRPRKIPPPRNAVTVAEAGTTGWAVPERSPPARARRTTRRRRR